MPCRRVASGLSRRPGRNDSAEAICRSHRERAEDVAAAVSRLQDGSPLVVEEDDDEEVAWSNLADARSIWRRRSMPSTSFLFPTSMTLVDFMFLSPAGYWVTIFLLLTPTNGSSLWQLAALDLVLS
ncbi:hypothetical protein R3P38DRAFT_3376612 [Favolaschia claudopus]|uniref:Uncharacterized protein n=1 Tax=Favolaschia claudopus TaxID=2862362 RepID=A0AAV9ZE77_9AGAR